MMQTKAKASTEEEPDDTMGSGAMGIATTEVGGRVGEFISQIVGFYIHVYMLLAPVAACRSIDRFIHTKL